MRKTRENIGMAVDESQKQNEVIDEAKKEGKTVDGLRFIDGHLSSQEFGTGTKNTKVESYSEAIL